jgi:ABC-type branched-subunit amino acid transport system substrate-binding protein
MRQRRQALFAMHRARHHLRSMAFTVAALCTCGTALAGPKAGTQIGAALPLSWPDKAQGEDIRNGMQLALKTWPGQSPPTLVISDDACEPKRAATAAQAFADAKVDVVVGGFCALGTMPRILAEAIVPFVSVNAVRVAPMADTAVQFGTVPQSLPSAVGLKLRSETGLRVMPNSGCWMDLEPRLADGFDAALCPTLHVDRARWNEIAPTYVAAYRKPFTVAAARGYAAMEVALAAVQKLRAGSRPGTALKDVREVQTVLGPVRWRDDGPVPDDAMQLVLAPRLPRLSGREAAAMDELMKAKGCGARNAADKTWGAMPFVVACPKQAALAAR